MQKVSVIVGLSILLGIGLIHGYSSKQIKRSLQDLPRQEKKREQSRSVYKGPHNPHSEKIENIAAIAKGDVRIEREIGLPMLTPSAVPFSLAAFLTRRACDADAIVIGTPVKSTSQLTEDGSFIYTAHELTIESVLKDNAIQPLFADQAITVFRTGGTIELKGRRIVAEDKAAKSLEAKQRYLLFLTFLPEKPAYAADNLGYQLKNEKTVKLTNRTLERALESGNDARTFLNSVRAAIAASCSSAGGER